MQQVDLPFSLCPWGLVSGDGVEAAAGSRPLFVQKPNHPRCDWSLSPPSLLRHQPSWVAAAASRRFPTSFLYAVLSPFSSLRNPELEIQSCHSSAQNPPVALLSCTESQVLPTTIRTRADLAPGLFPVSLSTFLLLSLTQRRQQPGCSLNTKPFPTSGP